MIDMSVEPKPESKGIKETLEIIKGLEVVVPAGVEIAADGKLSAKDVKPIVEVVKQYDVIVKAIENGGEAIGEAKDYDMIELAQIGAAFMEVVKKSKAAYAAGK